MVAVAFASRRLPPAAIALALALAWLALGPRTDPPRPLGGSWRASALGQRLVRGPSPPRYSVLFPAIGSELGARPTGVLSAVVSAVLFERLAAGWWGAAISRPAAAWFAVATVADLLIGADLRPRRHRGLAALLALQRRQRSWPASAVACSARAPCRPLSRLVTTATWAADHRRRAPCSSPPPRSGRSSCPRSPSRGRAQPCSAGAALAVLLSRAVGALAGPRERAIRIGAGLYAVAGVLAFALPTPMGSTSAAWGPSSPRRCCSPSCAPTAAAARSRGWSRSPRSSRSQAGSGWRRCARRPRRSATLLRRALLRAADRLPRPRRPRPARVEVPFTRSHWEVVHLAPRFPLARGWQTQLDTKYNPIFHRRGGVTQSSYARGCGATPSPTSRSRRRARPQRARRGAARSVGVPYLQLAWSDALARLPRPRRAAAGERPAKLVSLTHERLVPRPSRRHRARPRALDAVLGGRHRRLRRARAGRLDAHRAAARGRVASACALAGARARARRTCMKASAAR